MSVIHYICQKNYSAYVYEKAFLRIINPSVVWNENFDWRNKSLAEYRRRTEWRKELASMIIQAEREMGSSTLSGSSKRRVLVQAAGSS